MSVEKHDHSLSLAQLEKHIADGTDDVAAFRVIRDNTPERQFKQWFDRNRERLGLDVVVRRDRLLTFESTLVKNASATQESIKVLLVIQKEHLFIEAGCKSFPEYCAKNEKLFGIKNIYQLLQFEEMNPEFTELTGMPLRNKNVSRRLSPALAQIEDPKQAKQAMHALAKFAKARGDSDVSESCLKDWISHEGAPKHGIKGTCNNYPTPNWLFNPINEVFHFDVDVAADRNDKKCKKFFTIKQDGLKQDWTKYKAVWCNPPFSSGTITDWVAKAYDTALTGTDVAVLTPNSTETDWFHWHYWCADILLVEGRVEFIENNNNRFGTVLAFFHLKPLTEAEKMKLRKHGMFFEALTPLSEVLAWSRVAPNFHKPRPKKKLSVADKYKFAKLDLGAFSPGLTPLQAEVKKRLD